MRSFASLVFATRHPKMQQALMCIPAQDQGTASSSRDNLDRLSACQRRRATDRGNIGLVGFHGTALEHGGACDKGIGAGGGKRTGDIRANTAVDLDVNRSPRG